jgi:hypothetical protein
MRDALTRGELRPGSGDVIEGLKTLAHRRVLMDVDEYRDSTAPLGENKRSAGVVDVPYESRDTCPELRERADILVELEWTHG